MKVMFIDGANVSHFLVRQRRQISAREFLKLRKIRKTPDDCRDAGIGQRELIRRDRQAPCRLVKKPEGSPPFDFGTEGFRLARVHTARIRMAPGSAGRDHLRSQRATCQGPDDSDPDIIRTGTLTKLRTSGFADWALK